MNVINYLEESEKRYPNKIAIEDSERSVTYSELKAEAYKVSLFLKHEGVLRKPIAIYMKNSVSCISSLLGITWSGNYYTVLDVNAPTSRITEIIDILDPAFIITDRTGCECFEKEINDIKIGVFEEIIKNEYQVEDGYRDNLSRSKILASDILCVIFTSGSTGTPKGVVISHRAAVEYIEAATKNYGNISYDEIFGNQYPFFYVSSLDDIFLTIRNGAKLQIIPRELFFSPEQLVLYLIDKRVNAINWVPSALSLLAQYDALRDKQMDSLRKVIFGGEKISVKVLRYWQEKLPEAMFINGYGATETTEGATYYIVDRNFNVGDDIPLGIPMDHVELIVLNDEKQQVKQGETGELYVRSPSLAECYYKDEERTKERFIQNPLNVFYKDIIYKTGDLVYQDECGLYHFVGRTDMQIKKHGHRIELGDIENNIIKDSSVSDCACVYESSEDRIYAFYIGNVEETELRRIIKNRLPLYMQPDKYLKKSEFPRNANGKVDRHRLLQEIQSQGNGDE